MDQITIKFVIDLLEMHGAADIPVTQSGKLDKLSDCLRQLEAIIEKSPANVLLKDL